MSGHRSSTELRTRQLALEAKHARGQRWSARDLAELGRLQRAYNATIPVQHPAVEVDWDSVIAAHAGEIATATRPFHARNPEQGGFAFYGSGDVVPAPVAVRVPDAVRWTQET